MSVKRERDFGPCEERTKNVSGQLEGGLRTADMDLLSQPDDKAAPGLTHQYEFTHLHSQCWSE